MPAVLLAHTSALSRNRHFTWSSLEIRTTSGEECATIVVKHDEYDHPAKQPREDDKDSLEGDDGLQQIKA